MPPEHVRVDAGARPFEPGSRGGALVFIEDDAGRAMDIARERHVPVFVDVWAPWCHTCLSLREIALKSPELHPLRDAFVWLSIDSENEKNAAFLAVSKVEVLPTIWILDPETETNDNLVAEWRGAATGKELFGWLSAFRRDTKGIPPAASAAIQEAAHFSASGHASHALAAYEKAAGLLAPGTPLFDHAVVGAAGLLESSGDTKRCLAWIDRHAGRMRSPTARLYAAQSALVCAAEATPLEAESVRERADSLRKYMDDETLGDDRSDAFRSLIFAANRLGDHESEKALANAWLEHLESEVRRAPSKRAQSVYDAHRVTAWMSLGRYQEARALLESRERDFPEDYNHPARLARVLDAMGATRAAVQATARALEHAYGPRRLGIHEDHVRLLEKLGRREEALAHVHRALKEAKTRHYDHARPRAVEALEAAEARLAGKRPKRP